MRYAVVVTLESGKRATFSKRGRVEWADREKSLPFLEMRPDLGRIGYALPDYSMFGPETILPEIDAVIGREIISENRWRRKYDHTIPGDIRR